MSVAARERLADAIAEHVLATLLAMEEIKRVVVLSPGPPAQQEVQWRQDAGRGLNAELEAVLADYDGAVAVVLGDLPLLTAEAVRAVLKAAEQHGVALAPDRAELGTNALAMNAARRIPLRFGPGSLRLQSSAGPHVLVRRAELALDIDEPQDLDAARAAGWRAPD
jgi:2-phospho-L-lactate guanylyltransferase